MPYSHEEGYPGPPPEGLIWPPVPLILNDQIVEQPFNQSDVTSRYGTVVEEILKKQSKSSNPFFLHLAFENPHVPLFVSEEFEGSSIRGLYGDSLKEMDTVIGNIMKQLKTLDMDENTLIFFTSDNGAWVNPNSGLENVGNKNSGIGQTDGGSNGDFKDGKGSTWEGGIRVPAIAYWPNHLPSDVINRTPFMGVDLLPTFLEAAQIDVDSMFVFSEDSNSPNTQDKIIIDGISMLDNWMLDGGDEKDVILNPEDGSYPHDYLYFWREKDLYAIRGGSFKAHFITRSGFNMSDLGTIQDPPLLFNVATDPGENFPLDVEEYKEVLDDLISAAQDHEDQMEIADSQYLPLVLLRFCFFISL